ncbi:Protein of unknown function DUF262 [Seminavis robusta]|uniref:HNH Cas9-type domain-containing protein n=1 Tax=Seminavis robusta TaxID=568900 RepID=A0A9N8DXJ5_9STRA|nr:Protein of unknown function DUF262 [Seminavis robusta]|eukprot:Sro430_g141360.1 Protein of unknown function DUF262 (514) ;mRNA; f:45127-46668
MLLSVAMNRVSRAGLSFSSTRPLSRFLSSTTRKPTGDSKGGEGQSTFEKALGELKSEGLRKISPNATSIDALALWVQKGSLDLVPMYQRGYVWDEAKASRLTVTVLCDRIVPAVTVHEREDGVRDVVDGKQRLSTILGFYLAGENPELHKTMVENGTMPTSFKKLTNLAEDYDILNGLEFKSLSETHQRQFSGFTIPVTTIPAGTSDDDVFSCYEDINSGGEDLTAQQLRRAAFWGDYIRLLDELAQNKDFQRIRDPGALDKGNYVLCERESDRELILRAFAWERGGKDYQYKIPMKIFFNRELGHFKGLSDKDKELFLSRRKTEFEFIMKVWGNVFSEDNGAFRTWTKDGGWGNNISKPFWPLMYAVLTEMKRKYPKAQMYTECKKELQNATKSLFTKHKLALSPQSGKKFLEQKALVDRVLSEVLSKANPEHNNGPRRFAGDLDELRQRLYDKQEGNCNICNQTLDAKRIHDGSYAHLDHKTPHSKGGLSEENNAALAHAECNLHKGAKTE